MTLGWIKSPWFENALVIVGGILGTWFILTGEYSKWLTVGLLWGWCLVASLTHWARHAHEKYREAMEAYVAELKGEE